jgi:hypothetical protein
VREGEEKKNALIEAGTEMGCWPISGGSHASKSRTGYQTRACAMGLQFAALLNEKKAKLIELKEKADEGEEWKRRALALEERLRRGDFQVREGSFLFSLRGSLLGMLHPDMFCVHEQGWCLVC